MSDKFSQSESVDSIIPVISQTENKQFLRFYLQQSTKVMLPIKQITEVLKIQFGQIVPIPQMPPWVMGVYNWRGDILWMIDLGHLIGLNPWYQEDLNLFHQTAIVLSPHKAQNTADVSSNINLGLVISKVEDIETCNMAEIQVPPASSVNSELTPFLQGYWLQKTGEMIMLLNGTAIVAAMPNNLAS